MRVDKVQIGRQMFHANKRIHTVRLNYNRCYLSFCFLICYLLLTLNMPLNTEML
jgi:hypothetical protein